MGLPAFFVLVIYRKDKLLLLGRKENFIAHQNKFSVYFLNKMVYSIKRI